MGKVREKQDISHAFWLVEEKRQAKRKLEQLKLAWD